MSDITSAPVPEDTANDSATRFKTLLDAIVVCFLPNDDEFPEVLEDLYELCMIGSKQPYIPELPDDLTANFPQAKSIARLIEANMEEPSICHDRPAHPTHKENNSTITGSMLSEEELRHEVNQGELILVVEENEKDKFCSMFENDSGTLLQGIQVGPLDPIAVINIKEAAADLFTVTNSSRNQQSLPEEVESQQDTYQSSDGEWKEGIIEGIIFPSGQKPRSFKHDPSKGWTLIWTKDSPFCIFTMEGNEKEMRSVTLFMTTTWTSQFHCRHDPKKRAFYIGRRDTNWTYVQFDHDAEGDSVHIRSGSDLEEVDLEDVKEMKEIPDSWIRSRFPLPADIRRLPDKGTGDSQSNTEGSEDSEFESDSSDATVVPRSGRDN
ncbi:hypothetical protein M231_05471 [Tremella mesenterica]|uniref:Uncharacterized protein n=1 Tax=Tremella mesenterica TaxID=5217 RepID=A0A4Q1BI06_TREME|nr:hypothetical protein M231_05471 [Tremella mesenterica]